MNNTIRVGIIGIGNMGTAHAVCLQKGAVDGLSLGAVCDCDPQKRAICVEKFPNVPFFGDWQALITSQTVDAVIIATPHRLHARIAQAALEAGLHVMCEKPVDITVSAARRLNEAATKSDCVFGIMFNQRTNPLFAKARELVQSGTIGAIKRTNWLITNWYRTQAYYDSGDWRATWAGEGGGVLLNQAPHNLDLWQWICGMPTRLMAFCPVGKYHNIEVEDEATLFVEYENGATGCFVTSTGEFPGTNRLEIVGDRGQLVLEKGVLKHWQLETSERDFCFSCTAGFAEIPHTYTEYTPDHPETAHQGILQNFANAILHGEPLLASGTDGIFELTLSNAAYLSAWNNNQWIDLPLDSEAFDRQLAERCATSAFRERVTHEAAQDGYRPRWSVNW